jgi:hypothetical protein
MCRSCAVANACLLRSALAEQAAQLIGGRPLKTDSHMAVDVKSHTDCTVPKQFLNDLRVFASFKEHCCKGVACVVKPDMWQSGPMQQALPPSCEAPRINRIAIRRAEYKPVIAIGRTKQQTFLVLRSAVVFQDFDELFRYGQNTSRFLTLWFLENQPSSPTNLAMIPDSYQRPPYADQTSGQVNVIPRKS